MQESCERHESAKPLREITLTSCPDPEFSENEEVSGIGTYIGELVRMLEKEAGLPPEAIRDAVLHRSEPGDRAVIGRLAQYKEKIAYQEYRLIALRAVRMDGLFIENYPALCGDKDIVAAAVRQNPEALRFVCDEFRDDEDFIMPLLNGNREILAHCSSRLRNKYGYLNY